MTGFIGQSIVYLASATVAVPITKRLGLGSVVGYLLAGVAVGPFGFAFLQDVEQTRHFAEFGVVLLMFLIGMELNPQKLWELRQPIFGTGTLQVVATTFILGMLAWFFGLSIEAALVCGMGASLSSTAIALQILKERNVLKSPGGQISFAVLLFQDLAVIPMMSILGFLAPALAEGGDAGWVVTLKSTGAIIGVAVAGRYLLRPVFRFVANTELREVFTAFSLLLVMGTAALMNVVGLSMGLGTFLAGVLLANSEYRHELEIDIEPFKGLLMGLFFVAVGMSMDFSVAAEHPLALLGSLLLLLGVKLVIGLALGKHSKLDHHQSLVFAISLSQGGEFAFVLFGAAMAAGVLSPQLSGFFTLVVAFSMLTTSVMMTVLDRWIAPIFAKCAKPPPHDKINEKGIKAIIAGYGRFGQMVGRVLVSKGIPVTILDRDPISMASRS